MNSIFKIIINALLIFTIIGCSSNQKNKHQEQQQPKEESTQESFQTGILIEDIKCKQNSAYSFSLYLPKIYSIDKKFPAIYIFDSHARGKMPVELYKDLAEKYGYILIASNNSKNGLSPEISNNITSTLIGECSIRFSIDSRQVYTMGFSGGARVAGSIAINQGGIAGVIACGAGLPSNPNFANKNFHFMAMVGNKDFNYLEILNVEQQLSSLNIKNNICVFDGKHEWPKKETMEEAFQWLELNSMKNTFKIIDYSLIDKVKEFLDVKIKNASDNKQIIEEYDYNKKAINFLDGLTNITKYESRIVNIETSEKYLNAKQNQNNNFSLETGLQQKYSQAFQTQNTKWWKNEINQINKFIKINKNPKQSLVYERVKSYLSLIAYMYSDKTVKINDFANAKKFLQIYQMVDPTNSEIYYLKATIYNKQGNKQKTFENLNFAIDNGFEDSQRLNEDIEFSAIRQTKEFKQLIERLE